MNESLCLFSLHRGVRSDASLVPPIRQTASIFKQPVTVYKTQESKVKTDLKHGNQEKPKQLFWEKRLEVKITIKKKPVQHSPVFITIILLKIYLTFVSCNATSRHDPAFDALYVPHFTAFLYAP